MHSLWLIPTGKRQMLGNAILDLDKEVENFSCYTIYNILKIVNFIFLNGTLLIQWGNIPP